MDEPHQPGVAMRLWHLAEDTPRTPHRVSAGDWVTLEFGTWPIEPGQEVWVTLRVERTGGGEEQLVGAAWRRNAGANSYWKVEVGPFNDGDVVRYAVHGRGPDGLVRGPSAAFRVGPKLHLAILWHQHQPLYRQLDAPSARGSHAQPWVRLHAIRDYYSMASLVAEHPAVHLTINLTPVLLWQIEDYVERGGTDTALELTLTPAAQLAGEERETVLATFFDAHWHNQIFPHERYRELFAQRSEGLAFGAQDLRDLQMWFNLAWFGKEFRDGDVTLVTGETVSVHRFVEQQRDYSTADIMAMVAEQMKILRAIIPLHRALQDRGQIELSTSPFYHPILPLLADSDRATVDRPGTALPRRLARPDDAAAQVRLAVEHYEHCFGRRPRGMWPAEGAVGPYVLPFFANEGIRWIASDRGVLARSGRWGYAADDPDVLCQPYRAEEGGATLSIFFRDPWLADHIGFHYQQYPDYEDAAREFLDQIRERYARRVRRDEDRVLLVVLDGENAWGAYRDDARPFLHALYTLLERDTEIRTVTCAEYLEGNPSRRVDPHPTQDQRQVYDLYTGSWIDELGSAPGADLGTWIGEAEENRAWLLLADTREALDRAGASAADAPTAFHAMYAAEGSDWFWWLGEDQDSGDDAAFDELFRTHLVSVYFALGLEPPAALAVHLVPRAVTWSFSRPAREVQSRDRVVIQTHCPGTVTWRLDNGPAWSAALEAAGGVMAGTQRYHTTIGPFPSDAAELRFRLRCTDSGCTGADPSCRGEEHLVVIARPEAPSAPDPPAATPALRRRPPAARQDPEAEVHGMHDDAVLQYGTQNSSPRPLS
jgi:alpha-amylase/alpha-mannosidase (GH57 family)